MCASREGADLHPGVQTEDKVRTGFDSGCAQRIGHADTVLHWNIGGNCSLEPGGVIVELVGWRWRGDKLGT